MSIAPVRNGAVFLALLLIGCDRSTIPAEPEAVSLSDVTISASAWTVKAQMPTARSHFAVTQFKNSAGKTLIYVFGGLVNGNASSIVEAYDPAANTWTKKAPMPQPRFLTNGAAVIGNKIYVIGGWRDIMDASPSGGFFEYTPATNKWRYLGFQPFCGSGTSGVISGKLYVYCANDGAESQSMHRFDPATGQWEFAISQSLSPHDGAASGVVGGKFYLFGWSEQVEVYDPVLNSWTAKAPMFIGRDVGTAVLNGKIYVFGGTDTNAVTTRNVAIYDPATNKWTHGIPMPTTRSGVGAAVVTSGGKKVAYVIGGTQAPTWTSFVKRNELFDPTVPNKPPVAVANGPYSGTAGQPVQFSAQGTFDPEGAWNGTWTFGDGTSYTGTFGNAASQNPAHTYSAPGTYPVTFTVIDATGATSTANTTATIQ